MNIAAYFAIGLRLGYEGGVELVSGAEVQEWVNSQIRATETPNIHILDLAYHSENSHEAMYNILWWELAEQSEGEDILRELLSQIGKKEFESMERVRISMTDLRACPYLRLIRCLKFLCLRYDSLSSVFILEDVYWTAYDSDVEAGGSTYRDAWRTSFKELIYSFHKKS